MISIFLYLPIWKLLYYEKLVVFQNLKKVPEIFFGLRTKALQASYQELSYRILLSIVTRVADDRIA